jgi:fructose-bisphosphate aldolase class II
MSLVNLTEILSPAKAGNYAVAAFNDVNALYARAIIRAAEEAKAPLVLMVAEVHFRYVDLEEMAPYLVHVCQRARVPVALMLDHGASQQSVLRAIRCGFTAVMFDGSRLPFAENVAQTRSIVELAGSVGVSVEGEIGHVAGHEGGAAGVLSSSDHQLTDAGEAAEFVKRTGVDCLAVSVGTKHGFYSGEVRLDFARLVELREQVPVPLAIHGGSGLTDEQFRGLVAHGASKINYYTGLAATAARAVRAALAADPGLLHLPDALLRAEQAVEAEVGHVLSVFGSRDRAAGVR